MLCEGRSQVHLLCKVRRSASPPNDMRTNTDKTVSIIHAHWQDYASVNPSVLPWQWADEKEGRTKEGERWEGKWTVLELKLYISVSFRCLTNLPSTLTPRTPSAQVSHCSGHRTLLLQAPFPFLLTFACRDRQMDTLLFPKRNVSALNLFVWSSV